MMTTGYQLHGTTAELVRIETTPSDGFDFVGLRPELANELRVRVLSALRTVGVAPSRAVVAISWDDHGGPVGQLDLAVAVALAGMKPLEGLLPEETLWIGELAMDGRIRSCHGAVPAVLAACSAGIRQIVVPRENAGEARLAAGDMPVFVAESLDEVIRFLSDGVQLAAAEMPLPFAPGFPDMCEVRGQAAAKRALEIAAAGGHNVLLVGMPGAGKTMLARRLPGIMPPLSPAETLEFAAIWSAAGLMAGNAAGVIGRRPFRAPHHTVSETGLAGGGRPLRPGECSLAHRGVLFLDELPELSLRALGAVRAALADRQSRGMPADFLLIAAMNPCPCGWAGGTSAHCVCSPAAKKRYVDRVRPFLPLFDIAVAVEPTALAEPIGEASATVAARVAEAWEIGGSRSPSVAETIARLDGRSYLALAEALSLSRMLGGRTS